jgi:drug/metabolite transporter (DMT)-like permease
MRSLVPAAGRRIRVERAAGDVRRAASLRVLHGHEEQGASISTQYAVWVPVAFFIAACWGFIVVINKRTLDHVDPIALNLFARLPSVVFMALAVAVLTGFHLWSLDFSMTWAAAGYMTISSVATWLIAFNTYFLALRLGSVGVVAPIMSTDPIFTALFSIAILGTTLNGWVVGGLLTATAGVMLISHRMDVATDPHGEILTAPATRHTRRGPQMEVVLLSLVTAAGWGLAPVIIQLAERSVGGPSATMMLQSQVLGLVLVAPLARRRRGAFFTHKLDRDEKRLVFLLILTSGALEATFSVCYYLLIDHLGAVLTTLIVASSPIFSIVGGVALLRERLGLKLAIGAAITLAGVFLALAGT